jgi:glycosyltransferase involved in cell wall biosynthesis
MTKFSLIATVLNEGQSIHPLMNSLLNQSRQPDEIVLVDGGSTDDTCAIIQTYADRLPIKLLSEAGCNISRGRNIAIAAASGDVIVATDAGVRIPTDWFAQISQPFIEGNPSIVAGFFRPDPNPHSPFEVAMSATVLPLEHEIQAATFLPSSRSVAFRKSAWQAVEGYPEWLDYSEDLIFDLHLKMKYGDFLFIPQAYVYFKPRTSLTSFFKQYYLYARGDGKADLWRKRHAARYITYLIMIPTLAVLSILIHPAFLILYLLGGVVYFKQAYQRLPHHWGKLTPLQKVLSLGYIVLIRVVGDLAKMMGYPVGWIWRYQNHPPNWKAFL